MEKVQLNTSQVPLLMPAAVISVGSFQSANLITLAYVQGETLINGMR